jgi:hypothetical protein
MTVKDMVQIIREAIAACGNNVGQAMTSLFNVLAGGGEGRSQVIFGQGGFQDRFREEPDPGDNPNQVRHFLAWLYNGYVNNMYGHDITIKAGGLINMFNDITQGNWPDVRLSLQGSQFGSLLRFLVESGNTEKINDLLGLMERRLCTDEK